MKVFLRPPFRLIKRAFMNACREQTTII